MKQTAVKWFASKVMYLNISPKEMHDFLDWYEEAKEIEKEQIVQAHGHQSNVRITSEGNSLLYLKDGEQYYKETYEKDA